MRFAGVFQVLFRRRCDTHNRIIISITVYPHAPQGVGYHHDSRPLKNPAQSFPMSILVEIPIRKRIVEQAGLYR